MNWNLLYSFFFVKGRENCYFYPSQQGIVLQLFDEKLGGLCVLWGEILGLFLLEELVNKAVVSCNRCQL